MTQEEQLKAFEQALEEAWKQYEESGAATVDALEENTQELAFAKGFNAGYKQAIEHPTGGELLHVLNKGHEQGYKEAFKNAAQYVYHLCAHPRVIGIDCEELVEHFKKYMKKKKKTD